MPGQVLLIAVLAALVLLVLLIIAWKVHAFLALLIAAIGLGVASGMSSAAILSSMQKGIGDLLGSIAVIIAAGAIIGALVDVSGGAELLARTMIRVFGTDRLPWATLMAAYLVGVPVFFDAAFFTLIPLVWSISKERKTSLLLYALPLLAGLTTTHGFIPTHPGPAAAAQLLGADFRQVTIWGLALSLPAAVVGGVVWGAVIGKRIFVSVPEHLYAAREEAAQTVRKAPALVSVLIVVLLPVALIILGETAAGLLPAKSAERAWAQFSGHPMVALLLTAVVALFLLGRRSGASADLLLGQTSAALNGIGSLVLIIGASGALKQVILDCGAGAQFAQLLVRTHASPLLMAFLTGAVLRIVLGSATGAIVTAAGIVAPLAAAVPSADRALLVMAVAAGGSILSHVNDAGFWMVKEYCGMTVPQTLKSYSMMKLITSLTGFGIIWLCSLIT